MSSPRPYLLPEILDYIIDLLRDKRKTLERCCLVSKSWVPRTRGHLFADIKFRSPSDLRAWRETFPDPANSPAYHTRSLLVVTAADAEEGGWIRTFHNVVRLEVWSGVGNLREPECSLVPPSTISHRSSNLSAWFPVTFGARRFSTSFVPYPFSKT